MTATLIVSFSFKRTVLINFQSTPSSTSKSILSMRHNLQFWLLLVSISSTNNSKINTYPGNTVIYLLLLSAYFRLRIDKRQRVVIKQNLLSLLALRELLYNIHAFYWLDILLLLKTVFWPISSWITSTLSLIIKEKQFQGPSNLYP